MQLRRRSTRYPQAFPILSALLAFSMILSSCGQGNSLAVSSRPVLAAPIPSSSQMGAVSVTSEALLEDENMSDGLTIVLGEGVERPDDVEAVEPAVTTPLSAEETDALLDRVEALTEEEGAGKDFRLPASSLPAPRTGETLDESFPPAGTEGPVAVDISGPLEVVRYAPEGDIPIAPFLNVTFNQPMAPLATIEQLNTVDIPVKLTPELPGVWKWVGTKTLIFEYKSDDIDRFPKATEFTAEVPVGTESVNGAALAQAVTWTFRTPPPQVRSTYPSSHTPQPVDPLIYIEFDQRIDPAAVLEHLTITVGRDEYAGRLATEAEIEADSQVSRRIESAAEGRWLAVRAQQPFPQAATVNVNVGPGTPSAEGPLTTESAQSFTFSTYSRLQIEESYCAWGGRECPPLSPFEIVFNNPLDLENFDPAWITADPEIPGMQVENFGRSIRISGMTVGRTRYTVTISKDVLDSFGQTLGKDETVEFRTTDAPQMLSGPTDILTTIDPSAEVPSISLYTINYSRLDLRVFVVGPEDWGPYVSYINDHRYGDNPPNPPGVEVIDTTIRIQGENDQLVETTVGLEEAFAGQTGHVIVLVETPATLFRNQQRIITWVQSTNIALDAFVDADEMVVWANALEDGVPLEGVSVELYPDRASATTRADGTAILDLPQTTSALLVGRLGDDTALLPESIYPWSDSGWSRQSREDELRWYVFDDRQMYRPGEEVHIKGWVRRATTGTAGDIVLPATAGSSIQYTLYDSRGNEIDSGVAEVSELGGFDLVSTLPAEINLGFVFVELKPQGGLTHDTRAFSWTHEIQVQEFRRPEFEVSARNEDEGPFFVGDAAVVAVQAAYFAGGPLPNADTNWGVQVSPSRYSPPNWSDFTFGTWIPWWYFSDFHGGEEAGQFYDFTSKTDGSGTHYLKMDFGGEGISRPYTVQANASVTDLNRQTWGASTNVLVHPADLYVGLRSDRTFVKKGQPLEIEAIVTDLDGNPVADRGIVMRAARIDWRFEKGNWIEEEVDPQRCDISSTTEPVACTFETEEGGRYRIAVVIEDEQGRTNRSELTRWVSGGRRPPARKVEQEEVQLIPDKETYEPGDVAELLVQAPFSPAEGLLTVTRDGILYTERFAIGEDAVTLEIPIEDAHIPNLQVQVDVVGVAPRMDDAGEPIESLTRPAYAVGSLTLSIPPASRTLSLEIEPEATELAPAEATTIDVRVVDAAGEPVEESELAVVVVDEAVLALSNYQLLDPIVAFYQERGADVRSHYTRRTLVLSNPLEISLPGIGGGGGGDALESRAMATLSADTAVTAAAPAMEMAVEEAEGMMDDGVDFEVAMDESAAEKQQGDGAIAVRSNFNPLAIFEPEVRTDADGRAQIDFTLPDNLTRYRVMVVAVGGDNHFGSGEANMTARLPLMVRPSAPRFLNFGDSFELPVLVQNQTDEEVEVSIAAQVTNLALSGDVGQKVMVPANDRVEVRFPATTVNAGTARIRFAADAGPYADAASVDLPIYTPATTEAFATYGVVDEGAIVQPLLSPTDVFPQFGGLEINTSSTALQALTDAVLYLTAYPYECSEQLASRILGVAALRDVLTAFEAEELPTPEEMEAAVRRDIERLQGMQNWDGGFPIWQRGRPSVPYYSIHVAHALQRAESKGFEISEEIKIQSLAHLRDIESYYPHWYSQSVRNTLSAYALYVRSLMNDVDTTKARNLYRSVELEKQSLEMTAWLWQVLSSDSASAPELEEIRRHINNRAVETAGAANFTTGYGDDTYLLLHSNRRTDAVVLDALINDDPESDLIPKVVNGLMAHRTRGHWGNTQENVFVLLALDRYFNTFEAETPDFVARMWLGDTYVAEHAFEGRTTERLETVVPMSYLVEDVAETQDLVLAKEGVGRLYYRLGLRYAPEDLDLEPLDRGFVVQRSYEGMDDPKDVVLDSEGVWQIKAGARVRVRVNMVADNRRYHVALVDPLPAGLEILNPSLAVTEAIPDDPSDDSGGTWWWWGPWYEHQNLRDSRAEAFTTYLWDGVYEYSYVARATTPGAFVAPPAKAEEMYSPEVFGRSGTDMVVVK